MAPASASQAPPHPCSAIVWRVGGARVFVLLSFRTPPLTEMTAPLLPGCSTHPTLRPTAADPCLTASIAYSIWNILPCGLHVTTSVSYCGAKGGIRDEPTLVAKSDRGLCPGLETQHHATDLVPKHDGCLMSTRMAHGARESTLASDDAAPPARSQVITSGSTPQDPEPRSL